MSRANPELLRSALVAALGGFLFSFDGYSVPPALGRRAGVLGALGPAARSAP